jgi:hypothetical protein
MRRVYLLASVAALIAAAAPARPSAHEIPRHVIVQAFVKAETDRLHVLLRLPLASMRDMQFPEDQDGYLDLVRIEPELRDAVTQWILPSFEVRESGAPLVSPIIRAARISLPSDRSFTSYPGALAHVTGSTLPPETRLPWPQAQLDVMLEYPIGSDTSRFAIRPGFERLGVEVVTVLRFVTRDGVRAFEFRGDPGLVRLDPRFYEAGWSFLQLGFYHILDGVDHLLFLLCLVIPIRRLRPLIIVVTAFTAAHSIALAAAAWNLVPDALWFPPLVETLIAASIVYMALENMVGPATTRRRALLAFAFGIVHGFGFSFALTETLQFAGSHLLTSLFSFNLGVEIGQVLVLFVLVPVVDVVFRYVVPERAGTIILSALIAHVAWHWMADRWSALREFPLPQLDASLLTMGVRLLLVITAAAAVVWVAGRMRNRAERTSPISPEP